MPSSILSRQSQPPSPPSPTLTYNSTPLARPTHSRRPSTSYTPTVTSGGQQAPKVNVTRLAIEGRARQNADGASVKMYLKISLPIDSVIPGATIPLFQEENVKILENQVHPLDSNSVPYHFSSAVAPLLHNAARALNLPPRSAETFYSVFGINPSASASSSRAHHAETDSEPASPVDPYYTGEIVVSNYAISYTLPKVFLTRNRPVMDQEGSSQSAYRSRRASVGERNTAHFMAAIDMWVPYVSKPPRSPYLVSIPVPRCLHNHVKLRIFPPTSISSSVASLSSVEEDGSTWDLASDPHVARITSNRLTRSNSYSQFADDESSDSSHVSLSDGCSIQGTFPSAERIRIRWAKPMKILDIPDGDGGRRRVGVKDVKGEMMCVVQGKYKDPEKNVEGVVMQVAYKGTCKGIWFPGVATLLGMDVGLEAKNSDVSWAPGFPNLWEVGGGVGYTGFDVGQGPSSPGSRTSSLDSSLSGAAPPLEQSKPDGQMYSHPGDSAPSLLRAPLPTQNVGEYSFEGSSSESASLDGGSSFPSSMQVSGVPPIPRSPSTPITLHLNMNELLPPVQNVFTFTVSGTILLMPRATLVRVSRQGLGAHNANVHLDSEEGADSEPVVLPRFTVLAADAEVTSIIVRNEAETGTFVLEVYNATGDLKDAQIRKTVLQKGASTKCGDDGGRIALKSIRQQMPEISPLPLTPNGPAHSRLGSSSPLIRATAPLRPKRDGPLIIPAVENRITLFTRDDALCYAVRTTLNVPCDANSEWLEFGLALPRSRKLRRKPPIVSIVNASVEGVPVRVEMASANASDKTVATGVSGSFEQAGGAEWVAWIRMHAGAQGGTRAVVDYLVKGEPEAGKTTQRGGIKHLLLPTFPLPVGRLDGRIYAPLGLSISELDGNLAMQHHSEGKCRFLHISATEFFIPQVSLTVDQKRARGLANFLPTSLQVLPWLAFFITLFLLQRATIPTKVPSHLPAHLTGHANPSILTSEMITTVPVTITTTKYATVTVTSTEKHIVTRTDSASSVTAIRTTAVGYEPASSSRLGQQSRTTPLETATGSLSFREWSIPWLPDKVDTEVIVDKLWEFAEVVWQWVQKAYHYPLDPP